MNNRGFTLVELIAIIMLLAIIVSFGSSSIVAIINRSKNESLNLLIENIKDGADVYYQECTYSKDSVLNSICSKSNAITLGELVQYGYLKGNSENDDLGIVNPKDNNDISNCRVKIYYNGKVIVEAVDKSGSCPTDY